LKKINRDLNLYFLQNNQIWNNNSNNKNLTKNTEAL